MKKVLAIVLSAIMLLSLAACGNVSVNTGTKAEETKAEETKAEETKAEETAGAEGLTGELSLIHYLTESAKVAAFDQLVEGFKAENPGVNVTVESLPMDNYSDVIKLRFSTGEQPDIIFGQPKSYSDLVESGLIKKLDDYDFINRLTDASKLCVTVNDGYYGAPLDQMGNVVFYNKQIFADQGLEVPRTYPQFIETCQKLKDAGITPCAAGYGDDIAFGANWYTIFYGAPYLNHETSHKELMESASIKDYPEFAQALEQWREIMVNYQNEDYKQVDTATAEQKFANGETAMIIIGTWGLGAIMDFGPEFEVGGFTYPSEDKEEDCAIPVNIDDCWMVAEGSANEANAIAFLEFATRPEVNAKWCETASQLSALNGVECTNLPSGAVDIANEIATKKGSAWASVSTFSGQFSTIYTNMLRSYCMDDDMTIDEFMDQWDEEFAAAR